MRFSVITPHFPYRSLLISPALHVFFSTLQKMLLTLLWISEQALPFVVPYMIFDKTISEDWSEGVLNSVTAKATKLLAS